ncbi:hypothetical protein V1290_002866 [Bradyrhizobium sp. AZCC 1578]|uniref:HamA C-terminal domain-containing protein n=1 Tax=Bradyrhizobium sp. AZCC 1578 TaxID=3117027 RepID=UPI002FF15EBF
MVSFPLPAKLLKRIAEIPGERDSIVLCPDFEMGTWRYRQLAEHLFDWLPDVALRPKEREAFLFEPSKTLARSCRRLFDTDDPSKRGEVGEILLHAACRQEFGTAPFVARLFYKMRTNDSVTSVDVVHVLMNEEGQLELWLGEAKLYDDVQAARYKALASVEPLWSPDFLTEMKALIGPKIDEHAPYERELAWLFEEETSLDQIIKRIVVPICIAADFDATKLSSERSKEYLSSVTDELNAAKKYFAERIPAEVNFVVIFIPLDCKGKLESAVNRRVQSFL